MIDITPHEEYTLMADQLDNNRRAVGGPFFIKQKDSLLPHPSQVDTESRAQRIRYQQYKFGAEFPDYTKSTLQSMLGKMKVDQTKVELPDAIQYLEQDTNGDGLSLKGLLESCASNSLQAKWHILIADYKGLTDVGIDELSPLDIEKMNPRATINQYSRENVIDWYFSRVNGKMQLVYMLLRECGSTLDPDTLEQTDVTSYMRLVLDEDGYYQQKLTSNDSAGFAEGEKLPVMVGNEQLQFIPWAIASDCEVPVGRMPLETGFLTSIVDLALFRYRVSADYKESLSSLQPMVNISGIDQQGWDTFTSINQRDYIATGAKSPNIFENPETKVELTEPSLSLEQFDTFFERNDRDVRARGGVNNTDNATQRTATEILTESNANNAMLNPLASSTESAVKLASAYCAMFEGLVKPDAVMDYMDNIVIDMPCEFAISKLTSEEVKVLLDIVDTGLISGEEFLRMMEKGGWKLSEVDKIMSELSETPTILTKD